MNKKERMLAAMDQRPVDYVPSSFWYHFGREQVADDNCVPAHMAYYKRTDVGFMKIMSDGYGQAGEYDVKTASDWGRLRPSGSASAFFTGQLDRAKRLTDALGDEICTFYNLFAPFSIMRQQNREAMVAQHLKDDRRAVLEGLKVIAEDSALLAQALIKEAGCTGIYLALQGAEKDRFTVEEYAETVRPSDLFVLEAANEIADYNIAHLCGWAGVQNNLEVWRDYPAKVLNWAIFVEHMDLVEGCKFFGGKTVMGGFDRTGPLYKGGSEQEIRDFAQKTVRDFETAFSANRGLIIAADCTIPSDVDDSRFRWVSDALRSL